MMKNPILIWIGKKYFKSIDHFIELGSSLYLKRSHNPYHSCDISNSMREIILSKQISCILVLPALRLFL